MRTIIDLSRISFAVLLVSHLIGCAGLSKRPAGGPVRTSEVEEIDTYVRDPEKEATERGTVAFPPAEEPPVLSAVPEEKTPPPPPPPVESPSLDIRHVPGYRVQLYATREPEKAKAFAESAREHFDEKVYVEYLEPYYKVRIGDCLTHEEARLLLERAKAAGFDEGWITETLVIRMPESMR
jgi:hypothetical protein